MTAKDFQNMRKSLGLKQTELAAILGITSKQISNIETGVSEIKKLYMDKMRALGQKQTVVGSGNIQVKGNANAINSQNTPSKYAELFALIEAYATPKLIEEFKAKLLKIKEVVDG